MKPYFFLVVILFSISSILAIQVGTIGEEGVNFQYTTPVNYSITNTNSSTFWGIYNYLNYNMPNILSFAYNHTLTTYNLYNSIWSSTFNSTYNTWAYNQTPNLTGYAQYQFTSNNFNGSGNFTTTGQGRFNNGVGINILPNTNVGININLSGSKTGVNNTIILTGEQSGYGFYNTMKTNNPSSSNRFLYGVYQDFDFNTDGDGDVSFPIGYFNYNNLNLSGDNVIVYGDYNNQVITGVSSSGYGTRNVINAKATNSQGLGYSQSVSATGNSSTAYGFDVGVTAIAGATGQTLKGAVISTAGQTGGNTTTITGMELSHSAVKIDNPTVNQIGLKLSWNGLGSDVNNKKWALYNDGTLNNASKIFLGKDNVKTYFGTGYDASISYDGTNMIFNTNETGTGIAWFSRNVSATGYLTRTSVYDKSKGEALNYIKDSNDYLTNEKINHSKFYGVTSYQVTDYSKSVINTECSNQTIENKIQNICNDVTTYPFKRIEEGVDLGKEIDVLRQALFEVKDCTAKSKDWNEYKLCINGV